MQPSQPGPSTNADAATTGAGTPSKAPLMGAFRNGMWYCNCQPRLPAHQFTVKRDTENRGRTFYTCQHERGKANKCDFWLWAEEARARETNALLSNSRSEVGTPSRRGILKQMTLHESITPRKEKRHWTEKTPISGVAELAELGITRGETAPHNDEHDSNGSSSKEGVNSVDRSSNVGPEVKVASQEEPCAGSKRKRLEEDDEYGDFSSGEEEELVALTDRSTRYHDALVTPAVATRSVAVDDGIPTPLTGRPTRRVLFAVPEDSSAKRQRTDDEPNSSSSSFPTSSSSSGSSSSPSSSQQHANANPATPGTDAANLTNEVMALLRDQKVDEPVLRAVRAALDRHAAKARGLERGRDASRDAIKRAEARTAQLQHRITELENARALDAEARKKMRIDLMKLYRES